MQRANWQKCKSREIHNQDGFAAKREREEKATVKRRLLIAERAQKQPAAEGRRPVLSESRFHRLLIDLEVHLQRELTKTPLVVIAAKGDAVETALESNHGKRRSDSARGIQNRQG